MKDKKQFATKIIDDFFESIISKILPAPVAP